MRHIAFTIALALSACAPPTLQPYTYSQLAGDEATARLERARCKAGDYADQVWRDEYCKMVEHAAGAAFLARPGRL